MGKMMRRKNDLLRECLEISFWYSKEIGFVEEGNERVKV